MKFVVEIGKREKVGKRCLNIACTTTSAKCTATPIAWAVVPSQNLKPDVLMVQPAKDGNCRDVTHR